jgi:hypothetical protein
MTEIVLISDITFKNYEQQAGPAGAGCRGGRAPGLVTEGGGYQQVLDQCEDH